MNSKITFLSFFDRVFSLALDHSLGKLKRNEKRYIYLAFHLSYMNQHTFASSKPPANKHGALRASAAAST